MNGLILAGYGVYLVAIALSGNTKKFEALLSEDGGKFFPWIVAVAVLAALYQSKVTRPIVSPFVILLLVALMVHRFPTIQNEFDLIYKHYLHGSKW